MPRLARKHTLATRWFHWVNFPVLAAMVGSGLLIYWANDVYRVGIGGFTLVQLFPEWFYRLLRLDHGLALGMGWHFAFAWLLVLNGLAYVVYIAASGEWRELVPRLHHFPEAWQVVLHDLGIRKEPLPPAKFNAAQRVTYTAVIVMGVLSTLTGVAIYRPTQLARLVWICGGYQAARFEHFWLMMGFCAFFGLHLVQVARAGWNNLRSMIIGVERVDVRSPEIGAEPRSEVRS
jgi:thiosulfate reductase cytochrome b subunit